jgi:ribosomal protein S18 acetylase RimI-like enzyme
MKIVFQDHLPSDSNQVLALYEGVGWSAYTKEPERLLKGLAQSQVITAYVEEQLVGLIRCITDGQTILYIQDLLVAPEFQRQKIGQRLLKKKLANHPSIRQKVLITDNTEKTRRFYETCGFSSVEEQQIAAFIYLPTSE